jgi:hypothetical protein
MAQALCTHLAPRNKAKNIACSINFFHHLWR